MLNRSLSKKRKSFEVLMTALMLLSVGLAAALVLFLFIMLINATLNFFLKREKE